MRRVFRVRLLGRGRWSWWTRWRGGEGGVGEEGIREKWVKREEEGSEEGRRKRKSKEVLWVFYVCLESLRVKWKLHVQKAESARFLPSQLVPCRHHISNHLPQVLTKVIRTKFQVINNCREILGGLVSTDTIDIFKHFNIL